jgi:POT family proton-dependent oligopeptide transporter
MKEPAGHPRGLYVLFFTEMWERFSYYGMRALLVLYMVALVEKGGLGLEDKSANAIYGLYVAGVYMAALPGGWIADRLLGARRTVWWGGIIIALGQFILSVPNDKTFFLGLIVITLGTGMLKPNISAMVGRLYPEGGGRRDAGFTIFYMGINLGAMIGPLICGYLAVKINWHYGFAAAGVGMVLGLIQYRLFARHLDEAGKRPDSAQPTGRNDWILLGLGLAILFSAIALVLTGTVVIDPGWLAERTSYVIISMAVLYFIYLFLFGKLDGTEMKRIAVIAVLFVTAAIFFAGYEQAGSTLNLFAERYTNRFIGFLNYEAPASWIQSVPPFFVLILAPLVAGLWMFLARRQKDPSIPVKFGLGLLFLGLGFVVMAGAAVFVAKGEKVLPTWLIATYFLHTVGELCLSPVGLSSVTKLAPQRLVGQMMGIWFLATSLGNLCAGVIAGNFFTKDSVPQMPGRFMLIVLITTGAGIVLILLAKPIKKLMPGVK